MQHLYRKKKSHIDRQRDTCCLIGIALHCSRPVRSLLLFSQQVGIHDVWPGAAAPRTEPLALRLVRKADTVEVEPFYGTLLVVTANHFPVRHLNQPIHIQIM